jgi:hypothetical protein
MTDASTVKHGTQLPSVTCLSLHFHVDDVITGLSRAAFFLRSCPDVGLVNHKLRLLQKLPHRKMLYKVLRTRAHNYSIEAAAATTSLQCASSLTCFAFHCVPRSPPSGLETATGF